MHRKQLRVDQLEVSQLESPYDKAYALGMPVVTDQKTKEVLSRRIKTLIDSKGVSINKLARMTGDPVMTVHGIITGEHLPRAGILGRIANALGVSVEYFFVEEKTQKAS